jgi:gluconolactonase
VFAAPPDIETEIFTRMPDRYRRSDVESAWTRQRGSGPMHSFLEGPAFDRAGNLYCVDLAHGRIFRIDPSGEWALFAEYEGKPNGLKIHRDGRIFVADGQHGVLAFDPDSGASEVIVDRYDDEKFDGLNDLFFADNGDLFFTDPGSSSLGATTGRVFRLGADGALELIMEGLAYPNGLVLDAPQTTLYVAITHTLSVYRTLLHRHDGRYRWRNFLQLSGGLAGPDGMALDEQGTIAVVHAGFGTVWLFSELGEPIGRIRSCAGIRTTNLAYGGADRRSLYITEAADGVILRARLDVPGRVMYSHL